MDIAFPSVYTYATDPDLWLQSMDGKLAELARIYNGPIYPFLWPQYFDHEPAPLEIRTKFLDPKFWELQLRIACTLTNGAIIWGGWDFKNEKRMDWDSNAAWWIVTKDLLSELSAKH